MALSPCVAKRRTPLHILQEVCIACWLLHIFLHYHIMSDTQETTAATQHPSANIRVALFIKTFSRYGGVEQFCYRFCEYLKAADVDVRVYCGEDKSGEGRDDVHVMGLWRPGRFLKNLSLHYKSKKILSTLPKGTISVCFGNMAGCDIYRSGGPHSDFLRRSLRAQRSPVLRLQKQIMRTLSPINWLMPVLDEIVYPHPDTRCIVAISAKVRDAIREVFPSVAEKIVVIPNGVNTDRFHAREFARLREKSRQWYGLVPENKAIGFCATNFELKGLDRIISALTLLPPEYILIAAGGRDHAKYLEYARKLGVQSRVLFPGKVDNMARFYAALDVFCHPSFYDTFGSVVAEALSMGIPTVTTKDVGACDLIESGRNGVIVEEIEPQALSTAIWQIKDIAAGQNFDCVLSDTQVFARYFSIITKLATGRSVGMVSAGNSFESVEEEELVDLGENDDVSADSM